MACTFVEWQPLIGSPELADGHGEARGSLGTAKQQPQAALARHATLPIASEPTH
jgi:hypothetical protein